jgi:anti-sigma factor RsiW
MDTVNELDELDRQLREAAPYIDDDGFTRRVLATLPSRRVRRQPVRAAILLGASLIASLVAYIFSGGGRFVSQGIIQMEQLGLLRLIYVAAGVGVFAMGVGIFAAVSRTRDLQTSLWPRN